MALNYSKLSILKRFMSLNVNTKLVESLSQSAIAHKLGDINEILQEAPELNNYPAELWESKYRFFKNEGFPTAKFAFLIAQNPKLMKTPDEKIFDKLNGWRAFQFGERDTVDLIIKFPELLNVEHTNELIKKIETIKVYVGFNNVFKVIFNSPGIVSENVDSINEKIQYLSSVMKVEPKEVYNSEAFSIDLIDLRTRHVFLERLGLYIVKKKKDPSEISKNPKLQHITGTSDKRFATKVCHVTIEEFETFQELYQRELDRVGERKFSKAEDDD